MNTISTLLSKLSLAELSAKKQKAEKMDNIIFLIFISPILIASAIFAFRVDQFTPLFFASFFSLLVWGGIFSYFENFIKTQMKKIAFINKPFHLYETQKKNTISHLDDDLIVSLLSELEKNKKDVGYISRFDSQQIAFSIKSIKSCYVEKNYEYLLDSLTMLEGNIPYFNIRLEEASAAKELDKKMSLHSEGSNEKEMEMGQTIKYNL